MESKNLKLVLMNVFPDQHRKSADTDYLLAINAIGAVPGRPVKCTVDGAKYYGICEKALTISGDADLLAFLKTIDGRTVRICFLNKTLADK